MIVGIGTDITSVARIEETLERHGARFVARILTAPEVVGYEASAQPVSWLAKRFAAKEAASKALGTGIGEGVGWHHFQVENNALGAPSLLLSGPALARAQALGATRYHISLADEREFAIAYVVLES